MVQERLKRLEDHIRSLEAFRRRYPREAIHADEHLEWALRYGVLRAFQMIINIACHLASARDLGSPATYSECVDLLEKHGYLDADLAQRLRRMIGLRNILIHEYLRVDVHRLIDYLDHLDDFRTFVREVYPHLQGGVYERRPALLGR